MKHCFKTSCVLHVVLSNTANTSVFGWFAVGAGSHTSEEKTGTCDTFC